DGQSWNSCRSHGDCTSTLSQGIWGRATCALYNPGTIRPPKNSLARGQSSECGHVASSHLRSSECAAVDPRALPEPRRKQKHLFLPEKDAPSSCHARLRGCVPGPLPTYQRILARSRCVWFHYAHCAGSIRQCAEAASRPNTILLSAFQVSLDSRRVTHLGQAPFSSL
ncbi:hypothetical protein BGZ58_005409, partial [Dissophora ornata]